MNKPCSRLRQMFGHVGPEYYEPTNYLYVNAVKDIAHAHGTIVEKGSDGYIQTARPASPGVFGKVLVYWFDNSQSFLVCVDDLESYGEYYVKNSGTNGEVPRNDSSNSQSAEEVTLLKSQIAEEVTIILRGVGERNSDTSYSSSGDSSESSGVMMTHPE